MNIPLLGIGEHVLHQLAASLVPRVATCTCSLGHVANKVRGVVSVAAVHAHVLSDADAIGQVGKNLCLGKGIDDGTYRCCTADVLGIVDHRVPCI